MKYILLSGLMGLSVILFKTRTTSHLPIRAAAVECAPPETNLLPDVNGRFIPALTGWGHHVFVVSTKQDSAQFFFNQGISLYFSYHLRDAQASFMEAARFDSTAAMAYWGEALAMGPYYNSYFYSMKPGVPGALAAMVRRRAGATEKENRLIDAMLKRYSADFTNADRVALDKAYADALADLMRQYPEDDDIKALYIDAVMLEHKWDLWRTNGSPEPWTPELVTLCEGILKRTPRHPAGMHYYIHLTEASRTPELALPYADMLKDEMPGVGHMVHMATHSYQRNGLYAKGVGVNEAANTEYNKEDLAAPMLGIGQNTILHIFAVQSFCAMDAGMYSKGLPLYMRARERCVAAKPAFEQDPYSQFIYMIPAIADVRFGKWAEIIQAPAPDPRWKYAAILDDFARGMANVRQHDVSAAKTHLDGIRANLGDSLLNVRLMPFDKPAQCGRVAAGILQGEIAMQEGRQEAAIAALKQGLETEDSLLYREPQQWFLPVRQYLGACLLKANKAGEAEAVYRQDLVRNPGNGWSLLGLYQSLDAQHKSTEAAAIKTKYQKAFEAADVSPVASVF